MNSFLVIPFLVIAATVALVGCAVRPKVATRPPLPPSCSLPSLPPAEREEHEKRCDAIRQSAFAAAQTSDGFRFRIDLNLMPMAALREWASNEQNCCSFLRIHVRTIKSSFAEVQVLCPPEMREATMNALGLSPSRW